MEEALEAIKIEKETMQNKTRLGLQCQSPTSYLYLTKSFGFLFPQKIVVLKKFWSKKISWPPKDFLIRKSFWLRKKFWVSKKILLQKMFGPKKSMAENQFLVEISLVKQIFDQMLFFSTKEISTKN